MSNMLKRQALLALVLAALLLVGGCAPGRARPSPTQSAVAEVASATRAPSAATRPPATPTARPVKPAATAPPAPAELDIRTGKLTADAEILNTAGADATVLGSKTAGETVVVTGETGDRYQIVSAMGVGGHAWMAKSAVTFDLSPVRATPAVTETVVPLATEATAASAVTATVASLAAAAPVAPARPTLAGKIVFQDQPGGSIYLMNADGSGLRRLTSGIEPALSPDGTQVAFGRWDEPRGLWLINTDGSNERLVFGGNRVRSPSWTPDGQSVVFERGTGSTECRVSPFGCLSEEALLQMFGGEPCMTTPVGVFCIADYPQVTSWFTASTRYNLADGSNVDLPAPQKAMAAQVDPAGEEVVFQDVSGWSVTRIGGDSQPWPLVQERIMLGAPSYSPDGQYLFATRKVHDHWQIWRWRADGSEPVALTAPDPLGANAANNVAPTVSPDGRSVLFLTDRSGHWEMWVMNSDGANQRPLAPDALTGIPFRYDFNSDRTADWGK